MKNRETLEQIMERKVEEVRARLFYPSTPAPELTKETPNGSADIVSLKIQVNPDYINMLKDNGIPEEESLDETLSHEYAHITKFPGTAAKRMHQYMMARKLLDSKDLAESAVYAFNESQVNIFNGVDVKNKATPKVQKILARDSKGLNKILNGLYQALFKEDLGIKFTWRNKKEKDLVKELKEIQFTDQNNEDTNLGKFIVAVKDHLKEYKPRTQAGFLGMFNEEQIQEGLASLAQECMNNGYAPNQFEQLSSELANEGKIIPGAGTAKANLIVSRNIYTALARNYSIPIARTKMAKNGSLIPHEQKPFSIQTPFEDLKVFSSKGILPGISKAWTRKEGEIIKQIGIPDSIIVQDNSPSMPSPDKEVSIPVLGSSVIARTYLANDKTVTVYSFGSADHVYGPSKDEEAVNEVLRLHSGEDGGTTFNPRKLEQLLKDRSKSFDISIVSDMEISNLADFILSIKSLPFLNRIHLFYTNPGKMAYVNQAIEATKNVSNIGYAQLFTRYDIEKITMGELKKSLQ